MRLILQLLSLLVRGAALMLGLVSAGFAVACLGGVFSDRLDAFTHALPLWMLLGLGAVVLGGLSARGGERWVMVGLGFTALIAGGALMAPEILAARKFQPATVAPGDLKIVQFNVWHDTRKPQKSLEWLLAQDADVVVLEEAAGEALPIVKGMRAAYPYASCDKSSRCETWIFSRKRMVARGGMPTEAPYLSGTWATLADAKGPFTVVGVHYTWPYPAGPQQAQARKLAKAVEAFDQKGLILTGDFNSTPWSFALKRQDETLALRRWTLALPSWPVGRFMRIIPAPAPFLPIDHVYAGSQWRAVKVERGPALGSDHRPVVVTLRRQ